MSISGRLFGRAMFRAMLEGHVDAAPTSQPSLHQGVHVMVVNGHMGMGKTKCIIDMAAEASRLGVPVFVVRLFVASVCTVLLPTTPSLHLVVISRLSSSVLKS